MKKNGILRAATKNILSAWLLQNDGAFVMSPLLWFGSLLHLEWWWWWQGIYVLIFICFHLF